jgi:predicted dienelactone hydrolase
VIVFNHGEQGDPQQYTSTFEMWTRAGYVVAALRHPITVTGGPGGHFVDDIVGEVKDVRFVIESLEDSLGDLVDLGHLAVLSGGRGGTRTPDICLVRAAL